jgi:hypothetical protein
MHVPSPLIVVEQHGHFTGHFRPIHRAGAPPFHSCRGAHLQPGWPLVWLPMQPRGSTDARRIRSHKNQPTSLLDVLFCRICCIHADTILLYDTMSIYASKFPCLVRIICVLLPDIQFASYIHSYSSSPCMVASYVSYMCF